MTIETDRRRTALIVSHVCHASHSTNTHARARSHVAGATRFQHEHAFLFAVYKQALLESVDAGDSHRAFGYLVERLKPLEHATSDPDEFRELCYVVTCAKVRRGGGAGTPLLLLLRVIIGSSRGHDALLSRLCLTVEH